MAEQETVKVYELAKELGIDSISLLDKLKGLNISVKNHMSDLRLEEAQQARSSMKKPAVAEKPVAKRSPKSSMRTSTTKSATAPKATTKSAATKTATAKAPSAATRTRKKAEEPATEEQSAPKLASPIIRRRVKADGETETLTPAALKRPTAQETAEAEYASEEETQYQSSSDEEASYGSEQSESSETGFEQEQFAGSSHSAGHSTVQSSGQSSTDEAPMEASGSQAHEASGSAGMSSQVTGGLSEATSSARARTPVVLTPRPVAPRRSILKIVEVAPPPQRPMMRPAVVVPPKSATPAVKPGTGPNPERDGFRIIKMTKENLDQMVEEEAAKKRGSGREAEIRPEDVRFADYRKKEMVFLPKKKKLPSGKQLQKTQITEAKAQKRVIEMQENITVQDLANQLSVKGVDVVRKLMQMGQMANINSTLDFDTATLIGAEYKYEIRNATFNEVAAIGGVQENEADLKPRPPIVTIMGHVDHGKTTLLDAIREANVAAGEAGGITQHIGAYTITKNGHMITFIDTPGHEAFSVMRARGANVTDIVILVVSADDGVMPQTREAVSHAKAAGVPIIVAVNKIDKPGAQPDKIKQGLSELDLLAEDWGGQTMFIQVSALKKTNIDKLLDAILLQAEVLDLKANPGGRAHGTVLESRLEKGRGPVVSVVVKRGTLRVGDAVVSGAFAGRVKAMMDDKGQTVKEAGPAVAVEILGFEGVPSAGEVFDSPPSEADARKIAGNRIDKARAKALAGQKISLEDLFSKIQTGDMKELNLILKADVFGSVEAIRDSLLKLSNDRVKVKVIMAAAGGITESDVLLASASNALIIGFNVRPETKARQVAEAEHVQINNYSIIYELIDDVKNSMLGLLDKKKVEKFLGRAEVRQIFSVPKIGVIAGSSVVDGKIIRGANVRLLRDSRVIFEGKMSSLRRFKDDAKEVATGFECGIGIENYNDLKPGDIIEAYQIDMIAGTFEDRAL
jgi:translation initiation factor IF-2